MKTKKAFTLLGLIMITMSLFAQETNKRFGFELNTEDVFLMHVLKCTWESGFNDIPKYTPITMQFSGLRA